MYGHRDELESAVRSLERITGLVTGSPVAQSLTSTDLLRPLTGPGRLIPRLTGDILPLADLSINGVIPSTGVKIPSTGVKLPSTGVKLPSTGAKLPSTTAKLPTNGIKVPSTSLLNKLQSENASLLSSNNLLKKETAQVKKGLLGARKDLSEAKNGMLAITRDLSDTKKQLSDTEKELLRAKEANDELARALQNKPGSSNPRSTNNPLINSFNTKGVRPDTVPVEKTSKQVSFAKAYPAPPSIATGLYSIDIPNGTSIRASCFTSNLTNSGFDINIDGDSSTKINAGGCIWLEIEQDHQDFQSGRFNTLEDHPWHTSEMTYNRRVSFARPYAEPPQIMVWLTAFDMDPQKNWRVKAYASDITATGFTINIDTWGDTQLFSAAASWISYPASKKDVCTGSFSTLDVRPYTNPQPKTSGPTKFPKDMFKTTPRILLGINSFDISYKKGLRVEVTGTAPSAAGMTWQLNTWKDTTLYSAGGSYIALT